MNRHALSILTGVLALFALAQPGMSATSKKPSAKAPLTFRVTGEAQASPEIAIIHFSIVGDGDSLIAAQEQVKQIEKAVVKALENQKIKRTDLVVERFAATPLQAGVSGGASAGFKPLGYRVQSDYKISLPVSSNSLENLMKIADAALSQGARTSASPDSIYDRYDGRNSTLFEYKLKDAGKLTQAAMENGMALAKKMAAQAAEKMGVSSARLKLVSVQVTSGNRYDPDYYPEQARDTVTDSTWHPIKAIVAIEAVFDVK